MTVPLHLWEPESRHLRCLDQVAEAFGVAVADLTGPDRQVAMARARFAGFWVVKQRWHTLTFPRIGKLFGGRKPHGVRHGFDRAVDYRERDPEFLRLTDELTVGCALWTPASPPYAATAAMRIARASRQPTAKAACRARNDFESGAPAADRAGSQSVRAGSQALLAALRREGFA